MDILKQNNNFKTKTSEDVIKTLFINNYKFIGSAISDNYIYINTKDKTYTDLSILHNEILISNKDLLSILNTNN